MTEKRYGLEMDKNCYKCIADVIDKKLYTDKKQVVDLLNSLSEENEQLKQILKDTVSQLDAEISKDYSLYAVRIIVDVKMFRKIKELCK